MPSKNIPNCSLKKTTGSILGQPRAAHRSRTHPPDEAPIQLGFQVTGEVVRWDEVLERDGDRLVQVARRRLGEPSREILLTTTFHGTPVAEVLAALRVRV